MADDGSDGMTGSGSAISDLIQRLEAYSQDPQGPQAASSFSSTATSDGIEGPEDEATRQEATAQLAEELMALQSIYTDEALHLLRILPPSTARGDSTGSGRHGSPSSLSSASATVSDARDWQPGSRITLALSTEIEPQDSSASAAEPIPIRIAITLPAFYPHSSKPPQLQLLSRYVGGFGVDHSLFGEILRAFYHQKEQDLTNDSRGAGAESNWVGGSMANGVNWITGEVILFEGIEWVKEKVSDWWIEREQARLSNANDRGTETRQAEETHDDESRGGRAAVTTFSAAPSGSAHAPFKGEIITAEAITDRKSVFVGYAARIHHPDDVPGVLSRILSDRKVAKAAHPAINAWVCQTEDGIVHRDCDDDGESAAGGRLAHLLSLLEVTNVIVVVTRWFGGIHLGADRFKLINRAARDALELAGIVTGPLNPAGTGGADGKSGKASGKR